MKKLRYIISYNSALRRFLAISKPYSASQMFVSRGILSFDELLRKSVTGWLRELKTVQTELYMPAYHHLFSYTLQFVYGGAHYCISDGTVLTCKFLFFNHLSFILILHIAFLPVCFYSVLNYLLLLLSLLLLLQPHV